MKKIIISAAFFLALTTLPAFAKSTGEIVTGSTNAALIFSQNYKGDDYRGRFNTNLGYDHAFEKGFEFGGEIGINISSGYSSYQFTVGPTYNFQAQDIENSYNVGVKAGILIDHSSGYTYDNAIGTLEGGKRFKLAEGITYSPGLKITKVFGAGEADPTFTFNIFKFSLFF
jgi:hypothetical protein